MKIRLNTLGYLLAGLMLWSAPVTAATMNDYCVTPSFIQETAKPNLLLMFDNSASAFDLAHIDKGSDSSYCYDETFTNRVSYEGYFKPEAYYSYNMDSEYFAEIPNISGLASFSCDYADTAKKNLCVTKNTATPPVVTSFKASGKYLNWLTASKFDVQKKALTGGKYDNGFLIAESRGCVGRGFVKEPLADDYVESGTNTKIGVTFHVKGAPNVSNYSAPSQGGQTQLILFQGNINYQNCDDAIKAYETSANHQVIREAVEKCLGPAADKKSLATDQKIVFQQTIQECWQYSRATPKTVGSDAVSTVVGKCGSKNGVYAKRGAGPDSISSGDADLLCGSNYTGYCFGGGASDNWSNWVAKEYSSSNDCIIAMHNKFCSELDVVPVTDPTDAPSITSDYSNLPAIIADLGIESQLGEPLKLSTGKSSFVVKIQSSQPSGLIQQFEDKIRFGGMKFNEFGSYTESAANPSPVPATKVCSSTISQQCGWDMDCPSGEKCVPSTTNKDGAQIFTYIGEGHCSINTGTSCTRKADCPEGQTCIQDIDRFINAVNGMTGATWTPFGEAFYNAIGYFAKDTTDASGKSSNDSLRLNNGDYLRERNPSEYRCQSNNVLLITDGVSTADLHPDVKKLSDKNIPPGSTSKSCTYFGGSTYLENLAWLAKNRNINSIAKDTTATEAPANKSQYIKTYVVFNGEGSGSSDDCDASVLLSKTASNADTTMYQANSPEVFKSSLSSALFEIAGSTASGTAASILSNSEGSGANILQAVFYPKKEFETLPNQIKPTSATWIGEMQNLWYYVDPYITNSTVREDTGYSGSGDHVLDVKNDYVVQFLFDSEKNETKAKLYKDSNGDGSGDALLTNAQDSRVSTQADGYVSADKVGSIWRAGKILWNRDVTSSPRKLYTNLAGATATGCDGSFSTSSNGLVDLAAFDWTANGDVNNQCILQKHLNAKDFVDAENIIKFTHGIDGMTIDGKQARSRTVRIDGVDKVWKLGDIISSTPRVQSSNKLNNYHQDSPVGYADATYADDTTDRGFANSDSYKERGVVYAGANDGMMHAFKMGKLVVKSVGDNKATLRGTDLGKEQWAFIPRDVLPYLKYLADPAYAHIYLVDGPSRVVDASIGAATLSGSGAYATGGCNTESSGDALGGGKTVKNYWACKRDGSKTSNKSWRTLLIGSMGTGGASANVTSACSQDTDCVRTPIDGVGFSSYYALDVTDQDNPSFLWSFRDDNLGAATTGAAVVRVAHKLASGEKDTNGRWFAVIGNGPTGPVKTQQYLGKSTNNLALFVLDLRDGTLLTKLAPATAIPNAFVGSITSGAIDVNRSEKLSASFYTDDAVYSGFVQCTAGCDSESPTWDGGVLRLLTKDPAIAAYSNTIYPKDWDLSILASGTGPVTAAIGKLQDRKNKNLWLYTGTGRYFYKDDDNTSQGKLLGIKDSCFQMNAPYGASKFKADSCKNAIPFNSTNFLNQTTLQTNPDLSNINGWYITMDPQDDVNNFGAERAITDPVAMSNGAVFFTSFMPSTHVCNFGGKSFMWGVKYDTGGVASSSTLQGKALVQVSTGSFEELNLATAFTSPDGTIGRKTVTPMVGKPPADPPPIVSASGNKPLKRIIHVQEK